MQLYMPQSNPNNSGLKEPIKKMEKVRTKYDTVKDADFGTLYDTQRRKIVYISSLYDTQCRTKANCRTSTFCFK